ncbi:MAG: formamidopyrimidine-DNA glycosylase [Planctomyces sp.]|nr:formamidopyrimidine-DNA glycosylase [Planctomyces sp.]
MPELPEVETMVRGIRPVATGAVVSRVEFCRCTRRPIPVIPDRRLFRKGIEGLTISEVTRVAKRICIILYNNKHHSANARPSAIPIAGIVVIEPRMTGLLLTADPPTTAHRRVCFHLNQNSTPSAFEFWDRRGLGTLTLMTPEQFDDLKQRIGRDALEISVQEIAVFCHRTARPIKVVLLDQSLIGGIGNLYASEILFRAAVSPERPANSLSDQEIHRIQQEIQTVLLDAIDNEGSTLGDGTYRTALNQEGGFQNHHLVYDKEGCLCSRCQRQVIQRIVQAQRSTFFCSHCQR